MDNKKNFLDKFTPNQLLLFGIVSLLIAILILFLGVYFYYTEYWGGNGIKLLLCFSLLGLAIFQSCSQKFNSLSKDQSEDERTFGSEVNQIVVGIIQNYWKQLIGIASLLISILCFFLAIYIFFANIGGEQDLMVLIILFILGFAFLNILSRVLIPCQKINRKTEWSWKA